ncbi:MAG: FAD-dependent oxidoreductase [Candidatus Baltobacteraceae bacterium]
MKADVVVVGGGPAGATTALLLARAGFDVVVAERAAFPRRKVCGEYLNAGALATLERLHLDDLVRALGTPLHSVRLCLAGSDPLTLPFERPGLSIERATLDDAILTAAVNAGARLVRLRVENVLASEGRVRGIAGRGEDGVPIAIGARAVVGADGVGSVVARKLGLARRMRGSKRFALGGHFGGCTLEPSTIEMHVGPIGYVALNPLGERLANVMVVVSGASLARWRNDVDAGVRATIARFPVAAGRIEGATRIGGRVAIGPLAFSVSRAGVAGAVLAGDAAGSVDPFVGGGVELALASACAAATAVCQALRDVAGSDRATLAYAREWATVLRRRRRLAALVALVIDVPPLARRVSRRLAQVPERAGALLAALTGVGPSERALSPAALAGLIL